MAPSLLATVLVLGAAHLIAYQAATGARARVVAGVLKPLPVLLLAAAVWAGGDAAGSPYRLAIALGLVLSAIGDVSLVFPNGFTAGLSAFLLAHLCYIRALSIGARHGPAAVLAAVVLLVVAGAMLRYLRPYVGRRLFGPVTLYVAALSVMVWCAVARAIAPGIDVPGAREAAAGAVLFLVSDGVLSVDRFAHRFSAAHAVVMVTYYLAQLLIAGSAVSSAADA